MLTVGEVFVENGEHLILASVGGAEERVTVFIKDFLQKAKLSEMVKYLHENLWPLP
jgi:hypothetical protein